MEENVEDLLKKTFLKLRSDYGFKRAFASEMASMAMEDIVEYRNSIMAEMERESELEFAREEGMEIGMVRSL